MTDTICDPFLQDLAYGQDQLYGQQPAKFSVVPFCKRITCGRGNWLIFWRTSPCQTKEHRCLVSFNESSCVFVFLCATYNFHVVPESRYHILFLTQERVFVGQNFTHKKETLLWLPAESQLVLIADTPQWGPQQHLGSCTWKTPDSFWGRHRDTTSPIHLPQQCDQCLYHPAGRRTHYDWQHQWIHLL